MCACCCYTLHAWLVGSLHYLLACLYCTLRLTCLGLHCIGVDTPFLTVLKTWTSPFEYSVIILVCVRLEFPEVSARVPCLRISELNHLVSGFAPNTCILPWKGRVGLVDHPHPSSAVARCHRLFFAATGNIVCRPALFVAGQHYLLPTGTLFGQDDIFGRPIAVHLLLQIFLDSCICFCSPPYTCMEGSPSCKACLVSFTRGI